MNIFKPNKIKEPLTVSKNEVAFMCGGMLGQALISGFMGTFLFLFYNRIGIQPWIVGLVLGITRVWDGVNDPVIGALIDRKKSGRNGKFRQLIINTALPVGIITILLFFVPQGAGIYFQCAWILVFYLMWDVLYTVHDISKWGLLARISPSDRERNKIITYSKTMMEVGLAFPKVFMLLIDEGNMKKLTELTGWEFTIEKVIMVSAVILGLAGIFLMGMPIFTKERILANNPPQSLILDLKNVLKNRTLLLLLLSTLLGSLVFNIGSSYYFFSLMEVSVNVFGIELSGINIYVLFGIISSIPALFFAPFTHILAEKIGLKNIIILNFISEVVFNTLAYFTGYQGNRILIIVLFMTVTSMTKAWQRIAIISMVTESIDYMEWRTGRRMEGETFAVNSLIGKVGSGVATAMSGLTLTLLKFNPSPVNGVVAAGALFRKWVWPLLMFGPVLSAILTILPVFFINYTGKRKELIENELRERRILVNFKQEQAMED